MPESSEIAAPPRYVGDPSEPSTLGDALRARAELTPSATFVSFAGVTVSYAEALARAERVAGALSAIRVTKGDRVAVMLPNCLEFLDLWFGSALLGAVIVPVNMALRGEGLGFVLSHSESRAIVADETVVGSIDAVSRPSAGAPLRFVRGESAGWTPLAELLTRSRSVARVRLAPSDLASILYTSGTTGVPKGVMNCHNAYLTTGYEFGQRHVRLRSDDRLYTSLPLFHINAQMLTTMSSLLSGCDMVLAPRFSASRCFDEIRSTGATVFNYIGAMLTMLYKQPERPDDRANPARLAIGAAAPKELWRDFEQRFDLTLHEIYGLTETATYCVGNPPDRIRPGTIGVAVSWADVEVQRADGSETDTDEPGEIVIRAHRPDILFSGYFKSPEATAEAMRGGWFHSGDRGLRASDGYISFLDRIKDSIRRRGENISSFEVERVVNSFPAVAESAAVGVPSDLGEEDVMIVVVPVPGEQIVPAELLEFCSTRMASFMVPRYVLTRASLPKTGTERVQKFTLRAEGVTSAWDAAAVTPR
jgi:crotonobetaine/carnitine-CoA ligase